VIRLLDCKSSVAKYVSEAHELERRMKNAECNKLALISDL
jgi:hypothetical protein